MNIIRFAGGFNENKNNFLVVIYIMCIREDVNNVFIYVYMYIYTGLYMYIFLWFFDASDKIAKIELCRRCSLKTRETGSVINHKLLSG